MFVLKNKEEGTYFGIITYGDFKGSYKWVNDLESDMIKIFETKDDAKEYIHNTLIAPFYTEDEPIIIEIKTVTTIKRYEAIDPDVFCACSGQLQKINISAVEASCGYCEHFNDIAHNCEYYHAVGKQQKKIEALIVEIDELKHKYGPGYMQDEIDFSDKTTYLEEQLARAYELIKRGTKQSTEGLIEGIKYDNDIKAFLKDYELREGTKNNKETI